MLTIRARSVQQANPWKWRFRPHTRPIHTQHGGAGMSEGSEAKFLEAERQVFAGYSLTPKVRQITLRKPALTLRALELGSGEPALFLHGMGGSAVHWASLLSRLPSFHKIAINMPGHGASEDVDFRGVDLRSWYKNLLTGCLDG